MTHYRYFSGNSTIDPLANFSHEPVVKLHEAVLPSSPSIANVPRSWH
ncbi:hypothetical protein ACFOGG_07830 [Brenneria rubrifaciens]